MTKRGVLEDTALGLAEATWSDPVLAAVALLVSTLLVRDAWWDVGAAFLAWEALRGSSWKVRGSLFIASAALFWQTWTLFKPEWYERDFVSWAITAAVAVVVLVLGARGRPRTGIVVGAVTIVVGTAVIAGFAAAFGGALAAPQAATAAISLGRNLVLVAWTAVAGLAVRLREEVGERPDAARLLVVAQRRPFTAATVVAAFVLFGCLMFGLPVDDNPQVDISGLIALSFGASFLANLSAAPRSQSGALATLLWTTSVVFVWWAAPGGDLNGTELAMASVALLWPVAVVYAVPRELSARAARRVLWALAVAPVFVALVSAFAWATARPLLWTWLASAPIAFQTATTLHVPPRRILAAAAATGAAFYLPYAVYLAVAQFPVYTWDLVLRWGGQSLLLHACIFFLGGVYVVLARRARSLCAVEFDAAS